ncbi:hypothetical protein [Psychrobacter sp. Cmf 22.2]|uniref:hypothetical protein n=1 Tax=Psychrobacter sp. Cmf 22.2 TaxID=1926478 RepID=UPI0015BBDBB3|nr:hypothetical protein [Psychrobacter sp. Cmf 22.2]
MRKQTKKRKVLTAASTTPYAVTLVNNEKMLLTATRQAQKTKTPKNKKTVTKGQRVNY